MTGDFDDFDDPGEAAREQARTPATAHRRRVLNALLAAWDAHPALSLGEVMARAIPPTAEVCRACCAAEVDMAPDADLLAGLRALVKG